MGRRTLLVALRISSLLIVFLVITVISTAQRMSFPGNKSDSKSRNGRYVVQNLDYDNRELAHDLVLLDTKNGTKTKIYSYGRGVDLLWSPQSDAFVINDHEGSDSTRPLLYSLPWTDKKTDLLEKLTDFLRSRHEEGLIRKNDHVYFVVRRWIGPHELFCELEAYGEASPQGSGYKGYYVYRIGEGFRVYTSKN